MRKFILFLLLLLLIAGTGTLTFGFWNAGNIRAWSESAQNLKLRHDGFAEEKYAKNRLDSGGGKKMEEMKSEMEKFSSDLEAVSADARQAVREIEELGRLRAARTAREELIEYYLKSERQVKDILSVVEFMSRLFEVAAVFDRMKGDATLEDIQKMISEAKSKSGGIEVGALPDEMKGSGAALADATDNFLEIMEKTAGGEIESSDRLNESYAEFSRKESEFFSGAKKYIDSLEDLKPTGRKIDNDLMILRGVKFSVK